VVAEVIVRHPLGPVRLTGTGHHGDSRSSPALDVGLIPHRRRRQPMRSARDTMIPSGFRARRPCARCARTRRCRRPARSCGDGHLVVWSGVSFWRSLMRLDLIDEFRLDLYLCCGRGYPAVRRRPQVLPANPAADMHDDWESGELGSPRLEIEASGSPMRGGKRLDHRLADSIGRSSGSPPGESSASQWALPRPAPVTRPACGAGWNARLRNVLRQAAARRMVWFLVDTEGFSTGFVGSVPLTRAS
jgi:hypothetical protein